MPRRPTTPRFRMEAKLLAILESHDDWITHRELSQKLGFGALLPHGYIEALRELVARGIIEAEQRRTATNGVPQFVYRAVLSEPPPDETT